MVVTQYCSSVKNGNRRQNIAFWFRSNDA